MDRKHTKLYLWICYICIKIVRILCICLYFGVTKMSHCRRVSDVVLNCSKLFWITEFPFQYANLNLECDICFSAHCDCLNSSRNNGTNRILSIIYFWCYISSSSCHVDSTYLPDPLPPPVSIVHHSREVFKATSCIGTELLYIGFSWSSNLCSSIWRGPQEYTAYYFVLLLQQCSACLVHLIWIIFAMGGR